MVLGGGFVFDCLFDYGCLMMILFRCVVWFTLLFMVFALVGVCY